MDGYTRGLCVKDGRMIYVYSPWVRNHRDRLVLTIAWAIPEQRIRYLSGIEDNVPIPKYPDAFDMNNMYTPCTLLELCKKNHFGSGFCGVVDNPDYNPAEGSFENFILDRFLERG